MSTTTSEEAIQPAAAFLDFVFSWVGQVQKRGRGGACTTAQLQGDKAPASRTHTGAGLRHPTYVQSGLNVLQRTK